MLKKIITSTVLFGFASLFSSTSELEIPQYVDFPTMKGINSTPKDKSIDLWNLGFSAFNNAPEIGAFVAYLKRNFSIDVAIETGTCSGSSTVFFSLLFNEVHTMEIVEEFYKGACTNLRFCNNVICHLGSSEKILAELLPSLKGKPILFYLDAHWQYWPLLDELEEISKTHRDNCIIIVDDFKVPGRKDIPYDSYNNHECSYEYIKDQLDKVYSEYTYHYVIPKNKHSRAKFVAIPKKWSKND